MIKNYEEMPNNIKEELEMETARVPNSPRVETLYKNLASSLISGDAKRVAEIFDVSVSLAKMIKEENEK